jgi:hypothetical protein
MLVLAKTFTKMPLPKCLLKLFFQNALFKMIFALNVLMLN